MDFARRQLPSLDRKQALFATLGCACVMLLIYFFEFSGLVGTHTDRPALADGTLVRCDGIKDPDKGTTYGRYSIALLLDTRPLDKFLYRHPKLFTRAVIDACQRHARIRIMYPGTARNDKRVHTVLGIEDLDRNTTLFTQNDFLAWKQRNRKFGVALLAFFGLGFIYSLFLYTGVIGRRTVADARRHLKGGLHQGRFMIRSQDRNGEAWLYLVLFSVLAAGLPYWYFFKEPELWMLPAAVVSLLAAYAYLVQVVNTNRLWFEHAHLHLAQGPLPWFGSDFEIPVDVIIGFTGNQQRHGSVNGPYNLFSVSLEFEDGESLVLFHTSDFEETRAIAELANEVLAAERRAGWRNAEEAEDTADPQ